MFRAGIGRSQHASGLLIFKGQGFNALKIILRNEDDLAATYVCSILVVFVSSIILAIVPVPCVLCTIAR